MSNQVTITWQAFGDLPEKSRFVRKATVFTDFDVESDMQLLNMVYQDTNIYAGRIWDLLQDKLPFDRTHTALSVGDAVAIDGTTYVVKDFGFEEVK